MNNKTSTGIERGIGIIQSQWRSLSSKPGVYRMINSAGEVLYVGKANNLKKRVKTYTAPTKISHRITRMVSETHSMEIVTTHTEVEALLLESNLIKRLKPKYNVLLRDDKSFPYIFISDHESWPMLLKHRGSQSKKGDYFGPFASAGAVNRSINALQRAFMIRNCTDSVFKNRNRPCLQYQIKRCVAPCVNLVSEKEYAELVKEAKEFLSGDSISVQKTLAARMQGASDALEFETAAIYRNRIHALSQIQSHQDINIQGIKDADIFALHLEKGVSCVQVFFYRGGSNYGNRAYFPGHDKSHEAEEILAAFIGQFYDNKVPPKELIISHEMRETLLLTEALSTRFGRKVNILKPSRGSKKKLLKYALVNAREALDRKRAETSTNTVIFNRIAELFELDATPKRIEVYDNSHIQGTNSVGAMIVAGLDGWEKNSYRKFNIRNIDGGGDKDQTLSGTPEASKEAGVTIKPGDD
ncbi:excinuclease ABC subunit UvrC, partial [bacterium]|nr:excinuclease ABC subunit UvrC [bacterium]